MEIMEKRWTLSKQNTAQSQTPHCMTQCASQTLRSNYITQRMESENHFSENTKLANTARSRTPVFYIFYFRSSQNFPKLFAHHFGLPM